MERGGGCLTSQDPPSPLSELLRMQRGCWKRSQASFFFFFFLRGKEKIVETAAASEHQK